MMTDTTITISTTIFTRHVWHDSTVSSIPIMRGTTPSTTIPSITLRGTTTLGTTAHIGDGTAVGMGTMAGTALGTIARGIIIPFTPPTREATHIAASTAAEAMDALVFLLAVVR